MNSVYRDDELISQIGSVGLPPFGGKRTFGYLPAGKTRSLSEVKLPIHVISGVRPGPTVLVQGAAHANEIAGSVGILNLLDTLDPKELSGTVIAVPVLNILGFPICEIQTLFGKIGLDPFKDLQNNPPRNLHQNCKEIFSKWKDQHSKSLVLVSLWQNQ